MEPDPYASTIAAWEVLLGRRPEYGEYIQHIPGNYEAYVRGIWTVVEQLHPGSAAMYRVDGVMPDPITINPNSYIGRVINDSSSRSLDNAWYRVQCIDKDTYREYDQPWSKNNVSPSWRCHYSQAPNISANGGFIPPSPLLAAAMTTVTPSNSLLQAVVNALTPEQLQQLIDDKRKPQAPEPPTNTRTRVVNLE